MQVGQAKYGMQTMNQALFDLVARADLRQEDAIGHSHDVEELNSYAARIGSGLSRNLAGFGG